MTRESYEKITGILRGHPRRIRLVCLLNHTLTGFIFVLYPAFLLLLFLEGSTFFLRALLVPAISFAAVTLFRRIFNAPRPYEKFGLPPAIEKDTAGKSFPSRHVFSVFIIAATIFYVHPSAGILLGLLGVVLAVLRVIGGVHEPRDVIAGALGMDSVRRARILCTLAVLAPLLSQYMIPVFIGRDCPPAS